MTSAGEEPQLRSCWRSPGAWLALAVVALLWVPRWGGPLDLRWDAGVYALLGTSLAAGEGMRLGSEPGEAIETIQYPPGLPALAALHARLLGSDDPLQIAAACKVSYLALSLLAALWIWSLARRVLRSEIGATLCTLLCVVHVQYVFQSNILGAELPFLVVTLGFFHLGESRARAAEVGRGLFLALAFALRTGAVALLLAWIAEALWTRHWGRAFGRALFGAVLLAPWQWYVHRVQRSDAFQHPSYEYQRADYQHYNVAYLPNLLLVDSFRPEQGHVDAKGLLQRVRDNLPRLAIEGIDSVSAERGFWERREPPGDSVLQRLRLPATVVSGVRTACAVLLALGGLVLFVRGRCGWVWYAGATAAMLVLTPWPEQFARYLAVIAPFLAIALFIPAATCANRVRTLFGRALIFGPMVLPVAIAGSTIVQVYRSALVSVSFPQADGERRESALLYYGPAWQEHREALEWIRDHTPQDVVIATSVPQWTCLVTGRRAIYPPFESDPAEARRLLDAVPVDVLLVDAGEEMPDVARNYGLPAVAAGIATPRAGSWRRAFRSASGDTEVWVHDDGGPRRGAADHGNE